MTEIIIKYLPKIALYALAAIALFFPYALISDRWIFPKMVKKLAGLIGRIWGGCLTFFMGRVDNIIEGLYHSHGPEGKMARIWTTGSMVIWVSIMLGATLFVSLFG